jgi:hypothetical protein
MNLRAKDAAAALKAFKDAVHGNVVAPEQVVQRARVCGSCPFRVRTAGISRMSEVLGLVANKHRVPIEVSGYSCDVCGCSLMMLLPAQKENLHKDTPEESLKRPAACWIKQEKS